jgi:putative PIN family toxin of toxin-antitoxin system
MRVVLDTNIFISALLGGILGVIVDKWKAGKFTLIITDAIAREYLDVINRSKFNFSEDEIIATTHYLLQSAEFITPQEEITVIVIDPTDNKFLEAAVTGKVNFIVSGDSHLLELKVYQGIAIVTAREFIVQLKEA